MIEYYARFKSYIIIQGKNTIFLPSILYTPVNISKIVIVTSIFLNVYFIIAYFSFLKSLKYKSDVIK